MANCKAFCVVFLALLALAPFAKAVEANAQSGESGAASRVSPLVRINMQCDVVSFTLVAMHPLAALLFSTQLIDCRFSQSKPGRAIHCVRMLLVAGRGCDGFGQVPSRPAWLR
jgi:hypothetical protein